MLTARHRQPARRVPVTVAIIMNAFAGMDSALGANPAGCAGCGALPYEPCLSGTGLAASAPCPQREGVKHVSTTSDRDDPRLTHGTDDEPTTMAPVYLVLSEEERAKGFVRPLRHSYRHTGPRGPLRPVRDLTDWERERYGHQGYVKFEPDSDDQPACGRFWTQGQLDKAGKGCGTVTRMNWALAATYARDFRFYGSTWCCGCQMHLRVGEAGEFTWMTEDGQDTTELVGT